MVNNPLVPNKHTTDPKRSSSMKIAVPLSQRILTKICSRLLLSINGGDRLLANLDLAYIQKKWLGLASDPSLRPVCKLWWPEKIALVLDALRQTESVVGDIAELGTYKGGATLLMAEALQDMRSPRSILSFDSFCGYPAPGESDRMDNGHFHYNKGHHGDTSYTYVEKLLRLYGVRNRIKLYEGWFEATLPSNVQPTTAFSFVLLDCNHYTSARYSLNFLYDKLSPGGIFIVDDYRRPEQPYHPEAPGIKKAVDEFLSDKPETLIHGAYSMWSFTKI